MATTTISKGDRVRVYGFEWDVLDVGRKYAYLGKLVVGQPGHPSTVAIGRAERLDGLRRAKRGAFGIARRKGVLRVLLTEVQA